MATGPEGHSEKFDKVPLSPEQQAVWDRTVEDLSTDMPSFRGVQEEIRESGGVIDDKKRPLPPEDDWGTPPRQ